MSHPPVLQRFQSTFAALGPETDMRLRELYTDEIVFEDPAHRIEGIEALSAYFDRLNQGLRTGTFHFGEAVVTGNAASVPWRMELDLRMPNKRIEVDGVSLIRFGERVHHQRDYFDLGALLYEQVPLLGFVVRSIRRRFARG